MIILRQGDRLPTVALLQSYLNQEPSSAEFLTVDGIFGPRTATAVRTYRMAHRLGSGETADHRVWNGVVGGEWQIIDSVDRSDHDSPVRRRRIEDHGDLAPYRGTAAAPPPSTSKDRPGPSAPMTSPSEAGLGGSGPSANPDPWCGIPPGGDSTDHG